MPSSLELCNHTLLLVRELHELAMTRRETLDARGRRGVTREHHLANVIVKANALCLHDFEHLLYFLSTVVLCQGAQQRPAQHNLSFYEF